MKWEVMRTGIQCTQNPPLTNLQVIQSNLGDAMRILTQCTRNHPLQIENHHLTNQNTRWVVITPLIFSSFVRILDKEKGSLKISYSHSNSLLKLNSDIYCLFLKALLLPKPSSLLKNLQNNSTQFLHSPTCFMNKSLSSCFSSLGWSSLWFVTYCRLQLMRLWILCMFQEAGYLRAKLEQCKDYIRHLEKHCATLRSALLQIPEGEKKLAAVTKEIENDKNFECLHCKIEELTMMLFNFVAST